MNIPKTALAMGLACASLGYPLAGATRARIEVQIAPPPVVVENAPMREGYVYAPGYWNWDDAHHRHVWHKGEYMRERHGEHWVPHRWEERGGRYYLNEGHWER